MRISAFQLIKRLDNKLLFFIFAIILAFILSFASVNIYRDIVSNIQQEKLHESASRIAENLLALSSNSKAMNAVELLGKVNNDIKLAAKNAIPPDSPQVIKLLKILVHEFNASNAFVMNNEGTIVDYYTKKKTSGTGKNLSYRSYYLSAMKGHENIFAAVGTNSFKRGLYHAAPIYAEYNSKSEVIGVIVIKVGFKQIESLLKEREEPVLLISPENIVFSANNDAWLFNALPNSKQMLSDEKKAKRYGPLIKENKIIPFPMQVNFETKTAKNEFNEYSINVTSLDWNDRWGTWHLVLMSNFSTWFKHEVELLINFCVFVVSFLIFIIIYSYMGHRKAQIQTRKLEQELLEIHKQTQSSIEYASLIQQTLIPDKDKFNRYLTDYFTIWQPKNIVGGDIYLFETLRNDDEFLLMVIDCTGHGVPGAFVTMLVKALERQLISKIVNDQNHAVSPAEILQYFNKNMKKMLKQYDEKTKSNAGFDGGIVYYHRKQNKVLFSGAETNLFYTDQGNIKIIKGNRHSVGYKKSNENYQFNDHEIQITPGFQFYLTTDGFIDQNGGNKQFPLGKKRFKKMLEKVSHLKMKEQQKILLKELKAYQKDNERNDDITVIGFKF
ncbi:MAG: SpoIIE family protein phosphatase [Gammaproteobacteria bacterium]|nr:SpoIIE family protein phosphatase [Gammaproteobacteria bacterium]